MPPYYSDIYIPSRSGTRIVYLATVGFSAFCILLLPFLRFDVSVNSTSIVRPMTDLSIVRSASSGFVKEVFVQENQYVKKGDLLLVLDPDILNQRVKTLEDTRKKLTSLANDVILALAQSRGTFTSKPPFITPYYRQIFGKYLQQVREAQIALERSKQHHTRQKKLFLERVIPKSEFEKDQFELQLAESAALQIQADYRSEWESQLKSLRDQIAETEVSLETIRLEAKSLEIRAPTSGNIQELKGVYTGSPVVLHQELARLTPDTTLCVIAYVNPRDIGLLREGMPVRYHVDAYNFHHWGMAKGNLTFISSDIRFIDNAPVFEVRCSLQSEWLELKSGFKGKIRKGMTGRARFVVCQRSAWDLLFDNVNDWLNPYTATQPITP